MEHKRGIKMSKSLSTMKAVLLLSVFRIAEGYVSNGLLSISITRHHKGDIFVAQGEKCYKDLCIGLSGGTAAPSGSGDCECKCTPDRPVFRDDLNICVDDIQECSLVPYSSSSGVIKKIPFVFLPLKGQIVYPSAEIIISDVESPVCVVSGGQFLGQSGWLNLRNNSATEQPFRLFMDEGRTYLQWLGETSLRLAMEGRIILVHLLCKDASAAEEPKIFTPCIAFRVAGNPSIREVMFSTDVHLKEEFGGGLSLRDYIAVGVCSLLLAVVYVASVFLYLHIRKRKQKGSKKAEEDTQLTLGDEGVIKSNPLLQASRHLNGGGQDNAGYISDSNSCCSESDQTSDLLCLDDEDSLGHQNVQTAAIVHPCHIDYGETALNQDPTNIEKLPEENVSIVETLEVKEHPETVKAMGCANGRRKLYFNPSYFEPDLLKAPPPAAVEFLMKIREVIAIAKHKMSAKKFSPSLLGIPEEEGSTKTESGITIRKQAEECEKVETPKSEGEKALSNFHLVTNGFCCSSEVKQRIIRKWLDDIPVMMLQSDEQKLHKISNDSIINKSKLWQINESNSGKQTNKSQIQREEKRKPSKKGKAPPLPPQPKLDEIKKVEAATEKRALVESVPEVVPPRPPPLPSFPKPSEEVASTQEKDHGPPPMAKNLMDAVIQELTGYRKNDKPKINSQEDSPRSNEEVDKTLESKKEEAGMEQNVPPVVQQDDHEYEIILLNTNVNDGKDLKIYNLPEILSKNDRTEGYSLVSEVYVNDGYSCCSGESPPSSLSTDSDKIRYDMPDEKPGRLTIHVNDSPEQYKSPTPESDNFEPDTLDRKPHRSKLVKRINEPCEENERYSNQKFQECCANTNNAEIFTDSLERPSIMLKTNGTFKRNSTVSLKEIDDLCRNFSWSKVENFGSLREIYEAKSRPHRRRTETTSLIDYKNNNTDNVSTLSWSEERRNKLLHRGIILHINEDVGKRQRRPPKAVLPPRVPSRPPKPPPSPRPGSGSASPVARSNCTSPSLRPPPVHSVSPRNISPPLPPPRSVPPSPPLRSTSASPVTTEGCKGVISPPALSPSNSIHRGRTSPNPPPPPRPPKTMADASPLLPPRNAKPPLPPKSRTVRPKPSPSKFATRPLPPLPYPRPNKECSSSSPISFKDPETLSTLSGASMDSLNSSDYEAFYTLPYEEENVEKGFRVQKPAKPNIKIIRKPSRETDKRIHNQRPRHQKEHWRGQERAIPHRPEDSGYLSTDSNDSFCPGQMTFSSHFSRIPEKAEGYGSQNSETEESLCDGASESGGESIATDSFFYGNFKKPMEKSRDGNSDMATSYSLRLSDIEVNSDTERHCMPIMVRP